jgi:hypothetical protein
VSRICCPLVSYSHFIHSFTCLLVPILPYFHSPCIFPVRPSHSILLSFAYLGAYCLQIACIIRLGDSERHATPRPRFAALRHPIFLVSTLPTTWPSIAPGRPLTGTHTHTHLLHTPIHSYIHSHITPTTTTTAVARNTDKPASRGSAHSPSSTTSDKSLGIGLQRTKKRTVSNTARYNTTTQHNTAQAPPTWRPRI